MGRRHLKGRFRFSHLNVGPSDFEGEAPLELDFDLEELETGTSVFEEGVVGVRGASDGRVILWKDELSGVIKTFELLRSHVSSSMMPTGRLPFTYSLQ